MNEHVEVNLLNKICQTKQRCSRNSTKSECPIVEWRTILADVVQQGNLVELMKLENEDMVIYLSQSYHSIEYLKKKSRRKISIFFPCLLNKKYRHAFIL